MWTLIFTVLLIWPSLISKGPGELSVWSDTNVTLECVGKGVLEWLYSGSPLLGNVQASFHLSPFPRNGTNVLVLVSVTTPETGVYTCTNGTSFHSVSLFVKDAGSTNTRGYDTVLSLVVGGVIGVGVVSIFIGVGVCAIMACILHKEKVRFGDEMDYEIKEEYFATLNLDALEALSADVRAHIDLDFLAQVTNTDPSLLDKYKPHPQQQTDEQNVVVVMETNNRVSPSRVSLANLRFEVISKSSDTTTPITPLRRPGSFVSRPTSPGPGLRHQVGMVDSSSEGEKQSFLRMLKMVESVDGGGLASNQLDRSPNTL